jgi:hypothetical protein
MAQISGDGHPGEAAGAAVADAAQQWDDLRGWFRRGETGPSGLIDGLRDISATVGAFAGTDRAASQLAYRVDLMRCELADPSDTTWALDALPRLWRLHRSDAASYPAHPDAVGAAVPPVDGDGEPLPDAWRTVWRGVALTAALDPTVPVELVDNFGRTARQAMADHGVDRAEAAKTTVDILLATARLDEAQRLLDRLPPPGVAGLSDPPTWTEVLAVQRDLDQRAMVALQRGDAALAGDHLADMEALPEAGGMPTAMQAESLIPLAATAPAQDTARRAVTAAQRSVGLPAAATEMLQVTEYLARAGEVANALGLVERMWPVLRLGDHPPKTEPHIVETLAGIFGTGVAAGYGALRLPWAGLPPVTDWLAREVRAVAAASEPTVAELAEVTGRLAREAVAGLDARNTAAPGAATRARTGALWEGEVPPADPDLVDEPPFAATPPLSGGVPDGLPDWADPAWFTLPAEAALWREQGIPELPPVGPVDLAALGAADLFTATVVYSLLGMEDAVAATVPHLTGVADDPAYGPDCAALADRVRHADAADAADAADGDRQRPLIRDLDRMLEVRVEAQQDAQRGAEISGAHARDILAARVTAVLGIRDELHPLIRRVIDIDVLLGGVMPDATAVRPALRALPDAVRLIPRAVPQLGAGLLTGYGDAAADGDFFDLRIHVAVAHLAAGACLCLPPEPEDTAGHPERGGDQVGDLLLLSRCLSGGGMLHESLALLDRGLDLLPAGDLGDEGNLLRMQLTTDRFPLLSDLGNDRATARAAGEAAESADHRGDRRTALYCRTTRAAALLDDGAFPLASEALAGIRDAGRGAADPVNFPHENYLLCVEECRLAAALTDSWFTDEWPRHRDGLAEAWESYRVAAEVAGSADAVGSAEADAVRGVLRINRSLVRAGRVDEAIDLISWATGITRGGAPRPRLEVLTEQALLLHVAGRDDEALLIFESVVQQARRAGLDDVVTAVVRRAGAAARFAGDPAVRDRYAGFVTAVRGS